MAENFILENPIFFLGIIFLMAFMLNLLFSKLDLPHILFYLLTGVIIGNFIFPTAIRDDEISHWFHIVEIISLGLIGFQIGTELQLYKMKHEPKLVIVLLLANVIGAFVLSYLVVLLISGNILLSLMLAALATSTAPATTIGVIKKLRSAGPLTSRVQWILAFDDVLSVMIVEAILITIIVVLGGTGTVGLFFIRFGQEVGVAILLGAVVGFVLNYIVERQHDRLEMMEITLAFVLFVIGLSEFIHTSAITSTMVVGAVVTNLGGDNYVDAHELLDILMTPILAIFFIFIGAKVNISAFYNPFPLLAILYFIARGVGKIYGTYFAARSQGIAEPMRSGLGFSLVAQGGVVLGLSALVNEKFAALGQEAMGLRILNIVIISTILSEIFGALGVDYSIKKNGEAFQADLGFKDKPNIPYVTHE